MIAFKNKKNITTEEHSNKGVEGDTGTLVVPGGCDMSDEQLDRFDITNGERPGVKEIERFGKRQLHLEGLGPNPDNPFGEMSLATKEKVARVS